MTRHFNGKTVICTIKDRFSKLVHAVTLSKLPSAKETMDLLMQCLSSLWVARRCLVRLGSAITAAFWELFCKALGASVSLSSGFHPQTNVLVVASVYPHVSCFPYSHLISRPQAYYLYSA